MQIRQINYSSHFIRALKKLPHRETELVRERLKIFQNNCFDPRLKTHKLKGKMKDYWSFSITHSHRVLFEFLGTGKAGFVDVGERSIYKE